MKTTRGRAMRLLKIAERCLLLACGIVLGRVLFRCVRPRDLNGNGRAARHEHRRQHSFQ